MIASAFSIYLLIHLGLLAWSFVCRSPVSYRLWILRLMLFGMAWDNLVLALGNLGADAPWYAAASHGRFLLHVLLLPLLIPFTLSAMKASGVSLAQRQWFVVFCWLFAAGAWWYGLWHDFGRLELTPLEAYGHVRLVSLSSLPPLATIAINLLLVPLAWSIWRRTGWPLLLIGVLFILLLNGSVGAQPWGYVAANGGEVAFVACLLATERFLARRNG